MEYIIGILAGIIVYLGSLTVSKFKKFFEVILGFSGGVMLGAVSFEVLPELFHLSESVMSGTILASISIIFGLLLLHILSFYFPLHEHGHHEHTHGHEHNHESSLGIYGSMLMIGHSFLDGLSIGLSFAFSRELGILVALAVLLHNFSDGINIKATLLHSKVGDFKNKMITAFGILAPLFGILISKFINISNIFIIIYLGFFAGSIIYLSLSDILPQAHKNRNEKMPIFGTLIGVLFVFIITLGLGHAH